MTDPLDNLDTKSAEEHSEVYNHVNYIFDAQLEARLDRFHARDYWFDILKRGDKDILAEVIANKLSELAPDFLVAKKLLRRLSR